MLVISNHARGHSSFQLAKTREFGHFATVAGQGGSNFGTQRCPTNSYPTRPVPLPPRCSPPRCAASAARLPQGAVRFLARWLRRPSQSHRAVPGAWLMIWHFGCKIQETAPHGLVVEPICNGRTGAAATLRGGRDCWVCACTAAPRGVSCPHSPL